MPWPNPVHEKDSIHVGSVKAKPDMDNTRKSNIAALLEVGTETAQNCDKTLDRIVDLLVTDGPDPAIFA